MPLKFLLDENLRGPLWSALVRHNARAQGLPIDVVRVADLPELPLSTKDDEILLWCEREERILLSVDYVTMPGHLMRHLQAGLTMPGILLIRPEHPISEVVRIIEMISHVGIPEDYRNQCSYIP